MTANFAPIQRSPAKSHYYRSPYIPRHYCLGAAHQAFTEKFKRNTNTPAANDGFPSTHEVVALSSFAILLFQENDARRRDYSCASPRQSPGEKMLHLRLLMLGILAEGKGQVSACFNTEGLHVKIKACRRRKEVLFLLVLDKDITHAMCLGYQTS